MLPLFLTSLTIVLFFSWLTTQGIEGSTVSVFSASVIIAVYITQKKYRKLVFVINCLLMFAMLYIQYYQPHLIIPYRNHEELVFDIASCFALNTIVTGLIILFIQKSYDTERQKIETQRQEFEQMNEELKVHLDINLQQSEEITCTLEEIQVQKQLIQKQNERLEIQNQELHELIATKDKFFSIIGHDLKNPISAIIGFSDLLLANAQRYDAQKIEQFSKVINESSKHIFDLLENLLTWARCQTGRIQFTPKSTPLDLLIDNALHVMGDVANRKSIEIVISKRCKSNVLCDSNMINTVIRNLVSNCIKFTPHHGTIDIAAEVYRNTVIVTIRDTGIGMTAEQLTKLFKPGEQLNTSGTDNEPGTGLGLFLCREFLQIHNNELCIASEYGKGSIFSFSLELAEKDESL